MRTPLAVAAAVSALGFAAGAVDVHAHLVPEGFRALLARHGAERAEGFPLPRWDAEAHVAAMDGAGVSCALLTLAVPQPWFGDGAEAKAACRAANEAAAALKARFPGRFRFCATLPLPDVAAALEASAAEAPAPLVRLSLIEVDPAHLEAYKALLHEGTATSVRVEPGVLSLYAVQEKERPTHFTILEIYASEAAYRSHLQTPHFQKYKQGTLPWVTSLRLVDTTPLNPAMPIKPQPQEPTP